MKTIYKKYAIIAATIALIMSCSSSSDSPETPIVPGDKTKEIIGKEVSSITDAKTLATRVYNYKNTKYTKAQTRSIDTELFKDVLSMPEEPTVPENTENLPASWEIQANKNYIIKDDIETQLPIQENTTIYVKGIVKVTNTWGGNGKIIILNGGKLIYTAGDNFFNSMNNLTIYNYGKIETTSDKFEIHGGVKLFCKDGLDMSGKDVISDTKAFYVGGELKCRNLYTNDGSTNNIVGNLEVPEQDLVLHGNLHIGGKFSAKSLEISGQNDYLYTDCCIRLTGDLILKSGHSITLSKYITAKNIIQSSDTHVILPNGSIIECDNYTCNNNGQSTVTLQGDDAKALVKVNHLTYNSSDGACYIFQASGSNSNIYIKVDNITDNNKTVEGYENASWGGNTKNYVGHEELLKETVTGCGGKGLEISTNNNSKKKALDVLGEIEYDNHDHEVSATCVQAYNGKLYISYHTRGKELGGCIEVLETDANKQTKLLQFLKDSKGSLDFNHLMIDGEPTVPALYLVGSSKENGAMMAQIELTSEGLLNTTDKNIEEAVVHPLIIVPLEKNTESKHDENGIIRDGKKLLVVSTRGYDVYDANSLESLGSKETEGKAKHITANNNEIAILRYNTRELANANSPANGTIEIFNTGDDITKTAPKIKIAVAAIEPNNGKNTIAIDNNNIYVCRSANGLTCYDKTSGAEKWTWQAPLTANTQKPQGYANGVTYDNNYVYLACGGYGIVVLDKNNIVNGKPEVIAKARVTGVVNENGKIVNNSANYVTLYNGYIYVAYGKDRLKVYELVDKK